MRKEEVEDEGSAPEPYDRQEENRKSELIPIDLLYIMIKYFHKSSVCEINTVKFYILRGYVTIIRLEELYIYTFKKVIA